MSVRTFFARFLALSLALALCCVLFAEAAFCFEKKKQRKIHANQWIFGQSVNRKDAIWARGVDAATISKKALPRKKMKKNEPDTRPGIDQALSTASKKGVKGAMSLSMEREGGSWSVCPQQKKTRPDEDVLRDSSRVVRAYADVKAGDDLEIGVGPELILKDEEHSVKSSQTQQPDSVWGLGMKFKYDF